MENPSWGCFIGHMGKPICLAQARDLWRALCFMKSILIGICLLILYLIFYDHVIEIPLVGYFYVAVGWLPGLGFIYEGYKEVNSK